MKNGLPPVRAWIGAGKRGEARIVAEQIGQQLGDRVAPERRERELPVARLLHPLGVVLGAEVRAAADCGCRRRASTMCSRNASLAGVDPVQVLDQRHRRLRRAARSASTWRITAMQLALARLRLELRRRALGIGDAEEVEEQRQRLGEALVEQHQRPAIFSRALRSSSSCVDAEVGAEHLERSAGTGCSGRARRRGPRRRACRGRGSARRTRSTDGSCRCPPPPRRRPPGRCPARRLRERSLERAQIGGAADEARRGRGRARRRSACAPPPSPRARRRAPARRRP